MCRVFILFVMILNVKLNRFLFKEVENEICIWYSYKNLGVIGRESSGVFFVKYSLVGVLDENGFFYNILIFRNLF